MENQKIEDLVFSKHIDILINKREGKKTRFTEKLYDPYNSEIASLARLIKAKISGSMCVCFYIDKIDNVWYATNKQSLGSFKNNGLEFFCDLVAKSFSEGAKEDFLRKSMTEKNIYFKKLENSNFEKLEDILMPHKNSTEESKKIARFVINNFYQESQQPQNYRSQMERIRKVINYYLTINNDAKLPAAKETVIAVSAVNLYLEDFLNIADLSSSSAIKIANAIRLEQLKSVESYSKPYNNRILHSEQRMLEHISAKVAERSISAEVYWELAAAVRQNRFTVSKFCCGHCYVVFNNFEAFVTSNLEKEFKKLGNSCAFFSQWSSPQFSVAKKSILRELRTKISQSLEQIAIIGSSNQHLLLENSQSEQFVNQIIVQQI